jgi:TRAP-type mannitol/chloroaromatic compound transport system permease small subunit
VPFTAGALTISQETQSTMKIKPILKVIDTISNYTGRVVALIAAPMIIALIYEVFARYVFKRPTIWSYEITYMIYGTHYLLGAAYTLYVKGHIRIDLVYMKLPPRGRALIDVIGYLVIFFPVMLVLVSSGYDMAKDAYRIREVSQFTPWQPVLWPFKSMMCVGFVLLVLQGVAEFLRSLILLVRGAEI